jgi:hypothetical protein
MQRCAGFPLSDQLMQVLPQLSGLSGQTTIGRYLMMCDITLAQRRCIKPRHHIFISMKSIDKPAVMPKNCIQEIQNSVLSTR